MGFLDGNKDKEHSDKFDSGNWFVPGAGGYARTGTPFIIAHVEKGTMLFNKSFRAKYKLEGKVFKIAFNIESFNTAFVINPNHGIPFFTVKIHHKSGVAQLSNKKLLKELKEAYEIKEIPSKIYLKPMYFGRLQEMDIYKMIAYKNEDTKHYDGRSMETQNKQDPYPYPLED